MNPFSFDEAKEYSRTQARELDSLLDREALNLVAARPTATARWTTRLLANGEAFGFLSRNHDLSLTLPSAQ